MHAGWGRQRCEWWWWKRGLTAERMLPFELWPAGYNHLVHIHRPSPLPADFHAMARACSGDEDTVHYMHSMNWCGRMDVRPLGK